jgi:C1A family cysteine protease
MTDGTLPTRQIRGYGWRPDLPDQRDLHVDELFSIERLDPVPNGLRKFSLRDQEPEPSWDQSKLGSCTAHGIGFAVQFARKRQGLEAFRPSRLAIYYGERCIEGTVDQDVGAMIRDGIRVVARLGAGPEDLWPYDIGRFSQPPPQAYFDAASTDQALRYYRCPQDIGVIKQLLYNRYPVVMGFTVYQSFEGEEIARTGRMPMPQMSEEIVGAHCTAFVGWDDDLQLPNTSEPGGLEDRNSWSTGWGDAGHFWMPQAYASDRRLSSDFWTIRLMETPASVRRRTDPNVPGPGV